MRLLIIEDEYEIADFLKKSFEKESFIVDLAEEGEQGSYLARINEYDAIILDYMLPKKNGLQIATEVREAGKSVPMIMLSIKSDTTHKIECFKQGIDDYVTKPFSFQELNARVHAILRRPYDIKSSIFHFDDVTINSSKQEVCRKGKNIYLTRKEFLLLECLVKENGKVISRGRIMEHVWDMNVDPFSNTLETHILNLRKKIGKRRGKEMIQTVPGRGYKIGV